VLNCYASDTRHKCSEWFACEGMVLTADLKEPDLCFNVKDVKNGKFIHCRCDTEHEVME
jgi:hypothetical protein